MFGLRHLSVVLLLCAVAVLATSQQSSVAQNKTPKGKLKPEPTPPIATPVWPEPKFSKPETIAAEIDKHIENRLAKDKIPSSLLSSDEEFLRRVYLDLTGRIPPVEKTRAFLESKEPNKRAVLIDELLSTPEYGQHFANRWCDLIVPRTPISVKINTEAMRNAFADNFNKNVAWKDTVAQLLTCQDTDQNKHFLAFYQIHGNMNGTPMANVITRGVTRRFMGVQMECAECHNDTSKGFTQTQYWGITAYFGRVTLGKEKEKDKQVTTILEAGGYTPPKGSTFRIPIAADGSIKIHEEARFDVGKSVRPKVFDGTEQIFADGKPMLPDFINWLTAPENKYLGPATVNRYWHHFFTKGLVDPVDDFHEKNPPTHPEILKLLSDEFKQSNHDIKHLIRCICNSKTYQRSCKPIQGNAKLDNPLYSRMAMKVMNAEVLHDSLCMAHANPNLFPVAQPKGRNVPTTLIRSEFMQLFKTNDPDGDPTEYTAGIPQMLQLLNHPAFNGESRRVTELLKKEPTPEQAIEELYLAALSRKPTPDEVKRKLSLIKKHDSFKEGLNGVLWSLVNQAEFILNR